MASRANRVLILSTGSVEFGVTLNDHPLVQDILARLPYRTIVRGSAEGIAFDAPLPESRFDDNKDKHGPLIFERTPLKLAYEPDTNYLILDNESEIEQKQKDGRLVIGSIVSQVGKVSDARDGDVIHIRKPFISIKFDRPLRWLARQSLAYLSVLGTAMSLLGAVSPLVALARWAKYIVHNWFEWTFWFWSNIFWVFHIKLPREIEKFLTVSTLCVYLALASRVVKGSGEYNIEEYNRDMSNGFAGMLVIASILLSTSMRSGGVELFSPLLIVGAGLLILSWLAAILASNTGEFARRVWRAIILFIVLLTAGTSNNWLMRFKELSW